MISTVKLVQLRNAEFIQYLKDVTMLCQGKNPEALQIKQELTQLLEMITSLDLAYNKERASSITPLIELLDAERDACIIGIRMLVSAYTYHYEPKIKSAALELLKTIDSYGKDLPRMNYQAETEMLTRLVSNFETQQTFVKELNASNLITWIERLKSINQRFAEQYLIRTKEYASLPKVTFLEMRSQAIEKYRGLVAMISARQTINAVSATPNPAYETLIQEMNTLIEQYNQVVENRTTEANGGTTEENSPATTPEQVHYNESFIRLRPQRLSLPSALPKLA